MDELSITSKLMRGIISSLLSKMIYKKFGYRVKIDLGELQVRVNEERAVVNAGLCAEMSIDEFKKFKKIIDE